MVTVCLSAYSSLFRRTIKRLVTVVNVSLFPRTIKRLGTVVNVSLFPSAIWLDGNV